MTVARQRPSPPRPAPITVPADALALIDAINHLEPSGPPGTEELVCLLLDPDGVGGTAMIVPDAPTPDAVLRATDCAVRAATQLVEITQVVVASVRPAGHSATPAADAERWLLIDELCAAHELELLEWFVVTCGQVRLPREALGIPSRWPHDVHRG